MALEISDHQDKEARLGGVHTTLQLTGGGGWGKITCGPLIFIEAVTGKHITQLFNMLSGASAGATIASSLNIPKIQGSTIPRYTALDANAGFTQTIQRAIPYRRFYYEMQLAFDLFSMAHSGFRTVLNWGSSKLDHHLNLSINTTRKFLAKGDPKSPDVDLKVFTKINDTLLYPINKGMGKGLNWTVQKLKHVIANLHTTLDSTFRFEDTNEPVLLKDTIVSHHITSMNVTRDEPAFHANIKTKHGVQVYVSDPDLKVADITTGSCAAQTIFDDFTAPNGELYSDMADVDTPLSPMSTLHERLGQDNTRKLFIVTTGEPDREDLGRMPTMLFLQQMMGKQGSPLTRRRTRYVNKVAARILRQNLGDENITKIDLSVTAETMRVKYADNPKVVRMAKILGFDLLERDQLSEDDRLPPPNIFDTSNAAMKKLGDLQWDMVWHNADKLVDMCKFLLRNSAAQGRISEQEAETAIENIEWLYPADDKIPDCPTPPHRIFPDIKEAIEHPSLTLDFNTKVGILDTIKSHFKRTASSAPPIVVKEGVNDNENPNLRSWFSRKRTTPDESKKTGTDGFHL